MEEQSLDTVVRLALAEDLCEDFQGGYDALLRGNHSHLSDVTSDAIFTDERASVQVHAKSEGVLSGSKPFFSRQPFMYWEATIIFLIFLLILISWNAGFIIEKSLRGLRGKHLFE